jgi:hypothetical protein
MKRLAFPLLVVSLALILPALTGCPQEPGTAGNIPSGNLGDGPMVLKGKVHTAVPDLESFTISYTPYTAFDVVGVYTGAFSKGEFNISITKKTR